MYIIETGIKRPNLKSILKHSNEINIDSKIDASPI